MKIEVDTHTHTVMSGHAFSTLLENVHAAKEAGLKGFVITEHGPVMQAAPPDFHTGVFCSLPETLEGIRMYHGVETNIVDFDGAIDMPEKYVRDLDFVIASIHDVIVDPSTKEQHTRALVGALNNPYVDCIGHPGNPIFPIDRVALVREAARLDKILEINNHSFEYRTGSRENCADIIRLCKQYRVRIAIASDAHFCLSIGSFEMALAEVEAAGFPEELIVNASAERFEAYIREKKKRLAP
jgi:putative hydrolase